MTKYLTWFAQNPDMSIRDRWCAFLDAHPDIKQSDPSVRWIEFLSYQESLPLRLYSKPFQNNNAIYLAQEETKPKRSRRR